MNQLQLSSPYPDDTINMAQQSQATDRPRTPSSKHSSSETSLVDTLVNQSRETSGVYKASPVKDVRVGEDEGEGRAVDQDKSGEEIEEAENEHSSRAERRYVLIVLLISNSGDATANTIASL